MAAAARRNSEPFRPEHIAAQYEALFTVLRSGHGSRSSSKAAGPWRRSRLLALGVAGLGQPVTIGCRVLPGAAGCCRVLPGGSLAFQLPEDQPAPAGWKLVLRPRTHTVAETPQLPLEQPGTGGDGRVRAVLDTRHWELAEGDFDVLLHRAGGSRSRWRLAVRAWLRPAYAEVTSVEVDDEAIRLRGSLHGRTARAHHCRFVARLQADGGRLSAYGGRRSAWRCRPGTSSTARRRACSPSSGAWAAAARCRCGPG